jgi:2-polyprenyl-3-methyl-5-hydroxy-6-metoxy-1,4-benzoquinol methylase
MLTNPEEIRIISKAIQKNVRDPQRSRAHFDRIFDDFLKDVHFKNTILLDLGPGQYDFGVLARDRGATVFAIDYDPAVVELGQHKGFSAKMGNLENIRAEDFDVLFDGIFCKYSIDAFWFDDEKDHENHIKELVKLIKRGGWAWIAPWNGAYKDKNLSHEDVDKALSVQTKVFKKEGFTALELTEELSKYYGVHGITANRALFILNLKSPETLEVCKRL